MTTTSPLQNSKGKRTFFQMFFSFCDGIIKLGAYIAGAFILIATFSIFYEVASRAIFGEPTIWATEISIYCIVGSCFLGSAFAVRTYGHITVDLLINAVNNKWKTVLAYLSNTFGLIFSVIFTLYGFLHVQKTLELGVTSSSLLRIPMYLPEMLLPIGGILMIIAFILQLKDGGIHQGGDHL